MNGYFTETPTNLSPNPEESDDGDGDPDFEQTSIQPSPKSAVPATGSDRSKNFKTFIQPSKYVRSGSLATIRVMRRSKLASKLREIFEIKDIEEVTAGKFP